MHAFLQGPGGHDPGGGEGAILGVECLGVECLQEGRGVIGRQGLTTDDDDEGAHHGHQGGRVLLPRLGQGRHGEVHPPHDRSSPAAGWAALREGDAGCHRP